MENILNIIRIILNLFYIFVKNEAYKYGLLKNQNVSILFFLISPCLFYKHLQSIPVKTNFYGYMSMANWLPRTTNIFLVCIRTKTRTFLIIFCIFIRQALQKFLCVQLCPVGAPVTFAKLSGTVPRTSLQPILLYAARPGIAVTAECYNRCQSSDDCAGFILDYERASCFRVPYSQLSPIQYVPARDSNFFLKICIPVPSNCTKRAWSIEYSPNTALVGYQQHVIPNVADQWQCAQYCLNGATQFRYGPELPCYSAQYQHWSKTCTLSSENRRTKPEAFNPAIVQEGIDYIENLCIIDSPINNVGCWHEPIYNHSILEIDLQISNIDLEQCRERCESEISFPCRGFSYKCNFDPIYGNSESTCYLHGDDSLTSGSLIPMGCSTYVERLTCIDLKVDCSANSMMLTLHYKNFEGRMFAVGYAEECGVNGRQQDVTTLVLPITSDPRALNRCGVFVAQSVGYGNRKLATAVVAIQRHPIIQTVGDRIAKITCIAEDGSDRLPRPLFNNITLDVTFGVAEPPIQTSITNIEQPSFSNLSPTARLRILDLGRGGAEAAETVLGEELELKVEINPPYNASMLRAGHLVASSGDGRDSLLLLDWRGCPPDPTTFPALIAKNPSVLSAVFKAFRFPTSPIIKFSLILSICDVICQPTDCGNGLVSWGRKKRAANVDLNKQEVPLQLAIIVRAPNTEAIFNTTDIAKTMYSVHEIDDTICVTWPGLLTLVLIFGIIQIFILGVCSYFYFRKNRKLNDQVSLSSDFQPKQAT